MIDPQGFSTLAVVLVRNSIPTITQNLEITKTIGWQEVVIDFPDTGIIDYVTIVADTITTVSLITSLIIYYYIIYNNF